MNARKTLGINLLLAALLAALIWLTLRWFEGRWLRPFDERAQVFSGDHLRLPEPLATNGRIVFVHFFDPACPCNTLVQQHLAELLAQYAPLGVDFYVLQKPASTGNLPAPLAALKPLAALPGAEQLPASPALALFERSGKLAYFGPYSAGAVCNAANSFVEPIVEALLDGKAVIASHNLAVGCFCEW